MASVSVIVPVHNGSEFLDETARQLESLLVATAHDVEVLVINDHSTDGSLDIISSWPERLAEVRVLQARERGVARARNQAVSEARGDFVWFTDADDSWSPEIIDAMVTGAESSSAGLVVANALKVFPDGATQPINDAPTHAVIDAEETLNRVLDGRIQGHLWNKLFARELLGENPFPLTRAHSDLGGLLAMVPRLQRTALVPQALYRYEIRAGSILNSADYSWEDLHACLAIATNVSAEVFERPSRSLVTFKYRNVVIPVTNECLRRSRLMDPTRLELALSETRRMVKAKEAFELLRSGDATVAAKALLLRFAPRLYTQLYRRAARATRIDAQPVHEAPAGSGL